MTYQEMRTELNRIQREDSPLSPAEADLIDILFEMLTALESQSMRIQELALNQLGSLSSQVRSRNSNASPG